MPLLSMCWGDDLSEDYVNPYLQSQGHTVLFDSSYYNWNGVIPNSAEVVLYLAGYEYGDDTGEDGNPELANQSLLSFVAAGGGLIFTEWYAYNELDEPLTQLLPVEYDGDYLYQTDWNVSNGFQNHPLVTELFSSSFVEGDGSEDSYSLVKALEGTTVVMENAEGVPMLSYTEKHGGTVIHVNDGLTYDGFISQNILSVLDSSVKFAANGPVNVSEPGILALMLLTLAGIRRRHT